MAQQKSFHHGDLKRTLSDVALSLLDQYGVAGVTIRAIARAAGVSHSAPVNHYKDRRALLTAIAEQQFKIISDDIERSLSRTSNDADQRIEAIAHSLMDYGFQYPNRYQLLWRSDLIDHEDKDLLSIMDAVYDQLCAAIELTAPNVKFDKHTIAVALWSMVHGYVDMRLSGMFVPMNDEISGTSRRDAMIRFFLNSLT
ncbi:MAG: TetR/AcrR family transcriptional regulator [Alphaproteobacteria bacterium]